MQKIDDAGASKIASLKVHDIFQSIQGESEYAGYPTTFVRLFGCNLKCSYCDTPQEEYKEMYPRDVFHEIRKFSNEYVCITGGEPFLQDIDFLCRILYAHHYKTSIETNGCVDIPDFSYSRNRLKIVMDVKMPSSGHYEQALRYLDRNVMKIYYGDEIKFVVEDKQDLEEFNQLYYRIKTLWENYRVNEIPPVLVISPVIKDTLSKDFAHYCAQFIVENRFANVKIQTQLHKILGVK